MNDLKIVYLAPEELTPYEKNTRRHTPTDIEQIWKPFYEMFENPAEAGPYVSAVLRSHQRATAKVISMILNESG